MYKRQLPGWTNETWAYRLVRGTATDGQWGSCFNRSRTPPTQVQYWQRDETTNQYWDNTNPQFTCRDNGINCYTSGVPVYYPAYMNFPVGSTTCAFYWSASVWLYCPTGHTCSANVKVNDIWSEGTQTKFWGAGY